jgi:hypothetical protein
VFNPGHLSSGNRYQYKARAWGMFTQEHSPYTEASGDDFCRFLDDNHQLSGLAKPIDVKQSGTRLHAFVGNQCL